MGARWTTLVIDAVEPHVLARFWAEVLEWQIHPPDPEYGSIGVSRPDGDGPMLQFLPSSEPKRDKNRLHLDLNPCDEQHDELERLLGLGARTIDIGQGPNRWVVLADPEDNEFCLRQRPVG
ncbi:MAG: VOC family protein [Actinomycetota bacterium]|nr:VOC family protein [Actinomycetota bacterium]